MQVGNPAVGLILCAKGDEAVAHYALGNLRNKVLAGEYRLPLPEEKKLVAELERTQKALRGVLPESNPFVTAGCGAPPISLNSAFRVPSKSDGVEKDPSPPPQAERGAPSALRFPPSRRRGRRFVIFIPLRGLIFTHIFGWKRG